MTRLKTADLFDELQPEESRDIRKPDLHKSAALDDILRAWEIANVNSSNIWRVRETEYLDLCKRTARLLPQTYSQQDIKTFGAFLKEYLALNQPSNLYLASLGAERTSLFLNLLINRCTEEEINLNAELLPENFPVGQYNAGKKITFIGDTLGKEVACHMTRGKVKITGNVGEKAGYCMKRGILRIKGNCAGELGSSMTGGKIIVEGNATYGVGNGMYGGKIHIYGNVARTPGIEMRGGEIYIDGKIPALPKTMEGGNIYHHGTLIFKDGAKIQ